MSKPRVLNFPVFQFRKDWEEIGEEVRAEYDAKYDAIYTTQDGNLKCLDCHVIVEEVHTTTGTSFTPCTCKNLRR